MKNRLLKITTPALIIAFSAMDIKAMSEKYPLQITAEKKGKVAEVRITGSIYEWNNSSEEFTRKVDSFLADGIKDITVYLNCPGGDVFVAAEIINQINRFPGIKKGIGGAIVASAATMIAIELDSFEMAENGQFMYHKPSAYLSGNEDKIESSLKLLKDLSAQYKSKYANKTGKTEDEIEAAWSKGDVWLTAKEALDQKFITAIIEKVKITPETKALFEACGAPIIPSIDENKNQESKMKNRNQIIAKLGLAADATDEQIEAAIDKNLKAAGEVETVKAEADKNKKQQVEEFVDGAILAKKATADQRENLITMGLSNFDSLKSFVASLPGVQKPEIVPGQGNDNTIRANWTLNDYLEKDPQALEVMAEKEPEKFKKLNEAHYNVKI